MAGKSVNWTEGQFIHPHHFQQAFLELQEQVESVIADYVPHAFGIASLAFSRKSVLSMFNSTGPSAFALTNGRPFHVISQQFCDMANFKVFAQALGATGNIHQAT